MHGIKSKLILTASIAVIYMVIIKKKNLLETGTLVGRT
jgi:hypothetical protein